MSVARDRWRWVTTEIAKIVGSIGMVQNRNAFTYQSVPEVVSRIRIERARFNPPGFERFSLNLEIDVADLEATKFTTVVGNNIGTLWGEPGVEYMLPASVPSTELADRLRADLEQHVLPVIQRCTNIDAVIPVVDTVNHHLGRNALSMTLAMALARAGRLDESRTYFQQSLGDPEVVKKIASAFGVTW